MSNPYETPRAVSLTPAPAPAGRPPRDWMIWLATAAILLLCGASGATGLALVLAWAGLELPAPFTDLSGSHLLEPLGAGGLSLTVVALAFGYGQWKAVFDYDLIWARTLTSALLIAAVALLLGGLLLAGHSGVGPLLLLPAAGCLLLGLCMRQWHRRLRISRLESPRSIVPRCDLLDS